MAAIKPTTCTIRSVIAAFSEYLSGKAVDSPRLSADLMCMEVLGIGRLDILTDPHSPISDEQWEAIRILIERRAQGEPVAYILGTREFYGREFAVTPATLIPRPETEHVIEEVVRRYAGTASLSCADLGTGSGCIAITIAAELSHACAVAVDMSERALQTASANAIRHDVQDRIAFVQGDFTTSLFQPQSLDCIATNPPYISEEEYGSLSPEVREFEPKTALVPGTTGLEHAIALIRNAEEWLKPGGMFIMEMGYTQAAPILAMLASNSEAWCEQKIIRDLAGLDRLILAVRTAAQCKKTTSC